MDEVFKHGTPFNPMKAAHPAHAVHQACPASCFRAHNVYALVSLAGTAWPMTRQHGLYGNILIQLSVGFECVCVMEIYSRFS